MVRFGVIFARLQHLFVEGFSTSKVTLLMQSFGLRDTAASFSRYVQAQLEIMPSFEDITN